MKEITIKVPSIKEFFENRKNEKQLRKDVNEALTYLYSKRGHLRVKYAETRWTSEVIKAEIDKTQHDIDYLEAWLGTRMK